MLSNPFSLWLFPPLALSLYSLWSQSKRTFAWAWGFSLQAVIILALSVMGFISGNAVLWSCAAWAAIFIFWGLPRMYLAQTERYLSALDAERTEQIALHLPYFYWGRQGLFWKEMVTALACFMRSDEATGRGILDKWSTEAPLELQSYIKTYQNFGDSILWQWQKVIDDYQLALKKNSLNVPVATRLNASRAYAELGDIESATKCLEEAKLEESRYTPRKLSQSLLPFFCITGDLAHVERILSGVSRGRKAMPEYVRRYWLGRCLIARNDIAGATTQFEQALHQVQELNKSSFPVWQKRIQHFLQEAATSQDHPPVWVEQDDRIWRILQRVSFIQSIVAPNKHSYVVAGLCLAMILMHALSNLYIFFPFPENEQLRIHMYTLGILDPPRVLAGEYWRLITYLFLHKDAVHCFVNVIGLYWFGRIAQNLFGTTRFLFIFFLTGLLSGISHTFLDFSENAAGASGAVMGVFGAVTAGMVRMKRYLPRSIWQNELMWLAGLAFVSTVMDQFIPHVAAFAHLGGMIAGVMFGLIVEVPKPAYAVKDKPKVA